MAKDKFDVEKLVVCLIKFIAPLLWRYCQQGWVVGCWIVSLLMCWSTSFAVILCNQRGHHWINCWGPCTAWLRECWEFCNLEVSLGVACGLWMAEVLDVVRTQQATKTLQDDPSYVALEDRLENLACLVEKKNKRN